MIIIIISITIVIIIIIIIMRTIIIIILITVCQPLLEPACPADLGSHSSDRPLSSSYISANCPFPLVRVCVCVYVWLFECVFVCTCVSIYLCIHVCMNIWYAIWFNCGRNWYFVNEVDGDGNKRMDKERKKDRRQIR